MDANKVDLYIMTNQKYFPADKIILLKDKMLQADDSKFVVATSVELKDPTVLLIVSLLLGQLGVDRFMLGDIGMGILKILTGGLCGILTIIDWFTVMKKARELNFNTIYQLL